MANKGVNSGSVTIDKPSTASVVASLQLSFCQIGVERTTLVELKKRSITDPECLSGDQAEGYKKFLEVVDAFCSKVADIAVFLRNEASKRNERFNLEADFKGTDAKAQDSLSKVKSARAGRLRGQ